MRDARLHAFLRGAVCVLLETLRFSRAFVWAEASNAGSPFLGSGVGVGSVFPLAWVSANILVKLQSISHAESHHVGLGIHGTNMEMELFGFVVSVQTIINPLPTEIEIESDAGKAQFIYTTSSRFA